MLESQKDDWCRVARKSVLRLAYWFSFSNQASRCVMVHMIEYLGLHVLMIFSKALRNVEATETASVLMGSKGGEGSSVAPGGRSSQLFCSGNQSPSAQSQRSSTPLTFEIFALSPVRIISLVLRRITIATFSTTSVSANHSCSLNAYFIARASVCKTLLPFLTHSIRYPCSFSSSTCSEGQC